MFGHKRPGAIEGAVLVVGREHLVAWLEWQRTRHDVERGRDVGHIHDVVLPDPQIVG